MKHTLRNPPVQAKLALCATVLPLWARLLATSQAQSETAVAEMMAAFSEMAPFLDGAAQGMSGDNAAPATNGSELPLLIERMLVGFQYQDRISQMLALLQDDMQRMLLAITAKDDAAALDCAGWLQRLESQYAMAEQRRDHQAFDGSAAVIAAANETTFF